MKDDKYTIAKRDSWKTSVIVLTVIILSMIAGTQLCELFPNEIANNVEHRSIDIDSDGNFVTIVGTVHRYNDELGEYMKIKRVSIVSAIDASEKSIQRMAEELDRHELYFNKKVRSQ